MVPHEGGTRYTARVIHGTEEGRRSHEEMGFHDGWSAALDQMVAALDVGTWLERHRAVFSRLVA